MLRIERFAAIQLGRGIVHMIMHSDQSRNHCVCRQIENRRTLRRLCTGSRSDALNFPVADDKDLVLFRSGSSTIDHSNVIENNGGLIVLHEFLYLVCKLR